MIDMILAGQYLMGLWLIVTSIGQPGMQDQPGGGRRLVWTIVWFRLLIGIILVLMTGFQFTLLGIVR